MTEREQRALKLAKQIVDCADRLDALRSVHLDAKAETRNAQEREKEAKKHVDAVQEEIDHLVGVLRGNERGQLPLNLSSAKKQSELPEEKPAEDGDAATEQTVTVDHGARMPITALLDFGLTQSKLDKFLQSKYGDTVKTIGELEALLRDSNGYYWKDINGWGEAFATGDGEKAFPAIHLKFRQTHPLPKEAHTGAKKCLHCGFIYRNQPKCTNCGDTTWEAWEEPQT